MKTKENIMRKRLNERYEKLGVEIKEKVDYMYRNWNKENQLLVIKRKRKYPEIGDVFLVNPKPGLYFWGIVLDNKVKHSFGDDLLVVIIFKEKITSLKNNDFLVDLNNMLIAPSIEGREYWTRGYFYTIRNIDYSKENLDYGFYDSDGTILDKNFNIVNKPFDILNYYSVITGTGIAMYIQKEFIIDNTLTVCNENLKLV